MSQVLRVIEAGIVVIAAGSGFGALCAIVSYGTKAIRHLWLDENEDDAFVPPSAAQQHDAFDRGAEFNRARLDRIMRASSEHVSHRRIH